MFADPQWGTLKLNVANYGSTRLDARAAQSFSRTLRVQDLSAFLRAMFRRRRRTRRLTALRVRTELCSTRLACRGLTVRRPKTFTFSGIELVNAGISRTFCVRFSLFGCTTTALCDALIALACCATADGILPSTVSKTIAIMALVGGIANPAAGFKIDTSTLSAHSR